jgi:hypothetical protein
MRPEASSTNAQNTIATGESPVRGSEPPVEGPPAPPVDGVDDVDELEELDPPVVLDVVEPPVEVEVVEPPAVVEVVEPPLVVEVVEPPAVVVVVAPVSGRAVQVRPAGVSDGSWSIVIRVLLKFASCVDDAPPGFRQAMPIL